jgi:hypothetical protein
MHKGFVAFLIIGALAACDRRLATPPAAPAPPPVAADPGPRLSLIERLGHEAGTRPAAQPPVEAVAAALNGKGVPLERWKQVLASPIGARFCMAGQTAHGNVVAVCEFADDQQAERGITYSKQTFDRLIPNRTLLRRASTVLTLTQPDQAPASIDEARAIGAIFATL